MATVTIFFKILSGDTFSLDVSPDITFVQFYDIVWRALPIQIPLQSLDIFRTESVEEPLPRNDVPVVPQKDEMFLVFIQTSHFTLQLVFVAEAFHNNIHYNVFDIVIHENETLEEDRHSFDIPFFVPLTQDGNYVKSYRYNRFSIKIFAKVGSDEEKFYDEQGINVLYTNRFEDEWLIDIPEEKQPLNYLNDILANLPLSTRTLSKMCEALKTEISEWQRLESGGLIE